MRPINLRDRPYTGLCITRELTSLRPFPVHTRTTLTLMLCSSRTTHRSCSDALKTLNSNPHFKIFITSSILLLMASLLFLPMYLLFLSSATPHPTKTHIPKQTQPTLTTSPSIQQACKATRYPETCENSLMQTDLPTRTTPPKALEIILAALNISTQGIKTAQSMSKSILDSSSNNPNRSAAAKDCIEFLGYSEYRSSVCADPEILQSRTKDVRAWLSAVLLYEYDCWSAFKYVNTTKQVDTAMAFLSSLMVSTSNALSMVVSLDLYGNEMGMWKPPETERSRSRSRGFPKRGGGFQGSVERKMEGWEELVPNVTVCKSGDGCYTSVQAAVNAAPEGNFKKFVIKIREGVYEETVRVGRKKTNLVFVGDGMGKTVITGKLSVQQIGVTTYGSASVGVNGDGFMARDITFENAAGPDSHQAVAFRSDSDLSFFENCEFLGHQDTLYAHSLRQFYKSCRIAGTVDFIFGNSATVFHNCTILIRPRQLKPEKGETNAVTAHGRTDPAQSTGFVFENCVVNGTDEYLGLYYQKPASHRNYLGRPWKEYSRTVFLQCYLGELIRAEGWLPWNGNFALATLYYGEFENSGLGANTSGRVPWSSQIPKENVYMYSLQSFVQADEWLNVPRGH